MQWPSEYLKANIDFDGMSKECYAKCGPCRDEVMQFELTDDFEHLPNSTGVRCYLHCQMVLLGVLEPNTAQLAGGKFIDLLADMDANERRIWIGMSRGCLKYVRNILDPVQFAYAWNVCAKHNDNEVSSTHFK